MTDVAANNWSLVLLLPPFVGLLYPPFYSRFEPALGGVPFFIWYQFAWAIVTVMLTAIVYRLRRRPEEWVTPPPDDGATPSEQPEGSG